MNRNIFKFIMSLLISILLIFCAGRNINAQQLKSDEQDNYTRVTIPAGTYFKGILQHKISTEFNVAGDTLEVINPADILLGETVCIPKSSRFIGKIVKLQKAQQGMDGSMQILFDTVNLPDDRQIKLIAHLWSKKGSGILGGDFAPRAKYRKMPHYMQDMVGITQILPDGPRIMGQEFQLQPGTEMIIVLDRDLKLNITED